MTTNRQSRSTRRVLIGAFVVACLSFGALTCGAAGAETKATTTSVVAKAPVEWDPRLAPIADKVAELRGLEFDRPVAAEFLDDAAFEKRVMVDKGKLTKSDKEDIERAQGQLRAVGLIGPDVDIVDAMSALQASGVLAYYSPKTKKITVKGTNADVVATRVTVAHELTHALQDQHFDLDKLTKAARKVHGSTALRTLIEGDAARIQDDYLQSLSDDDQVAYDEQNAATGAAMRQEIDAKGVPESLSALFQAPYILGPSMLTAVIARENVDGVDALFQHPPVADASFVTPTTLLEHRVFPTFDPPRLQAGEKRSGKPDVFGSLSLYQVLSSRLDPGLALTAADAWGGDAMVTFTRDGTTCLRTTIRGKTPDGTAAIGDALSAWAAQMPAGAATVDRAGAEPTLTACDPGAGATDAPNRALSALVYVANRDGLFATLLEQGLSVDASNCTANALVRDPAFRPVLDAAAADPDAAPDDALIRAVRSRVSELLAECQSSSGT